MPYRVWLDKKASKQLAALPRQMREAIGEKLRQLEADPRPVWSKQLTDVRPPERRIRVGNYRVTYVVNDRQQLVEVQWVGDRKDAYS